METILQDISEGNQKISIANSNYINETLGPAIACESIELSPRSAERVYLLTREFWNNVVSKITDPTLTRVMIQYQFKYLEDEGYNQWRSLGHISTTDFSLESMNSLVNFVTLILYNKEANYYTPNSGDTPNPVEHPRLVAEISIRYILVTKNYPLTLSNNLKRTIASDTFIIEEGKDSISLINSADPKDWSDVVIQHSNNVQQFAHGGLLYTFTSLGANKQRVDISSSTTLQTVQSFTDEILNSNNLKTFNRVFKGETRSYIDGVLIHSFENDTKFMGKGVFTPSHTFKVITMDLETKLNIDKVMEPISISLYSPIFDGMYKTYYVSDYEFNPALMIKACLSDLAKPVYDGYCIYLHNFSNFDGVFLLKILALTIESKNIKALIKDRKILDLTVKVRYTKQVKGKEKQAVAKIHFRDSMLLLNNSLSKLAKAFGVTSKGSFDMSKLENLNNSCSSAQEHLDSIRDELLEYNKLDSRRASCFIPST